MYWTNLAIDILLFFFVLDCAFMGLVIMMQRSKQEGLGAAFGGGITESVFGAQTSNVLVKATVYSAIIFFALSILLARLYSHLEVLDAKGSPVQQELMKPVAPATPAPTASATPAPAPTTPAPTTTTAPATVAPVPPANSSAGCNRTYTSYRTNRTLRRISVL
jgi:preprotein translocase subunit SecG